MNTLHVSGNIRFKTNVDISMKNDCFQLVQLETDGCDLGADETASSLSHRHGVRKLQL